MTDLFLFATEVLLIGFCWKLTEETFMFTKEWLRAAAIRAIRTMAQTAVATIGTAVAMNNVNWIAVLSASALAGILSVINSMAGLPEVGGDTNEN